MLKSSAEKVLIAPLDWGLGHATRCVPIIRKELKQGNEVILASNGNSVAFLKDYFPELTVRTDIPDYNIRYSASANMIWHFARDYRRILKVIKDENNWLNRIIDEEKITRVISDNRYGLSSKKVHSTFITHQLYIQSVAAVQPLLRYWLKKYISRFDDCMIPDYEGKENLSGKLSHGKSYLNHLRYIGPLSRFDNLAENLIPVGVETSYTFLGIISGPEPQRSILQEKILNALKESGEPSVLLCGLPDGKKESIEGNVRLISHADDEQFVRLLNVSQHVICRPGYSTLMDLHTLKKKALLIPTPGQTEQEYLTMRFEKHFGFKSLKQSEISLQNIQKKIYG